MTMESCFGCAEKRYVGFAYPTHKAAPHHFYTFIRDGRAYLVEDFGAAGNGHLIYRAYISERLFKMIRKEVAVYLNERIKSINEICSKSTAYVDRNFKKIPQHKGFSLTEKTLMDRTLGREMTILWWSLDGCADENVDRVLKNFRSYRPEELWWLFLKADRDGRDCLAEPSGWRKALPIIFQS